ncbi:signal peptidase II [Hazenella coriacea]|uniref:Lipoprotein signal peptidase n=1 Tax=Hazenella coriacea TaxID=1179467 RepID=A0A4R3LAR6_9BACL|nr:signal peptidase II [Hazenella coriacea]TCS94606.1 signal peptidase II [Hazenella coriacea]
MRYYWIALFILIVDQGTKWFVVKKMSLYESIAIIDQFFYFTSHRNRGAAFGILQNQQWLFIVITFVVIGIIVYYLWQLKNKHPWMSFAFASILGGAIGNLIDRIRTGEVVDFFHFQFGSYHYPIFNVADSAIVIGVTILVIITLFHSEKETESPESISGVRDS